MRDNRLAEILQGLDIQEAQHKMRDAQRVELCQFLDHRGTIARDEVLLWIPYNFGRVFRHAHRSQVRQLNISRIASNALTVLLEQRHFMRILLNSTRIEVIPIGIASDEVKCALLSLDELERDSRLRLSDRRR